MSDNILKSKIGISSKEMAITMFNVNSSPLFHGETCKPFNETPIEYLDNCINFFGNIRDQIEHVGSDKKSLDNILVPFWYSPNGSRLLIGSKKPFSGFATSEQEYKKINLYTSEQLLARWSSGDICAALGSKSRFTNSQTGDITPLFEDGYSHENLDYCVKRGAIIGEAIETGENCRYITRYKMENGKTNMIFICGDTEFTSGSVSIFKTVNQSVKSIMREDVNNKHRKGINLDKSFCINNYLPKPQSDKTYPIGVFNSSIICRLLAGGCMIHDYLCILRDFFGVEDLLETDNDSFSTVDINSVISDYAKVKKYTVTARALSAIA